MWSQRRRRMWLSWPGYVAAALGGALGAWAALHWGWVG
jgi:hypothetical protein